MKLDEFITNVLLDIDKGLNGAREKARRRYLVDTSGQKGVSFDIAVTTIKATNSQAEGAAKAGFIEVLGAGVGAKLENKNENSEASRIQFTVYVPSQTDDEVARDRAIAASRTRSVQY